MTRKLSFEFVKEEFAKRGCVLLSKTYTRNSDKLSYICSCGREAKITWMSFRAGQSCYDCRNKKLADMKRTSFEEVENYFESQGCILLSTEYYHCDLPLDFLCTCGTEGTTTFYNFKHLGSRCSVCARERTASSQRLDFGYVKEYFEKEGCVLLSKEYVNAFTTLSYTCKCGRYAEIRWNSFQRGNRCKACSIEKLTDKSRLTIEFVKKYFELQECELLTTEYTNSFTKMDYICACGNRAKVNWNKFSQGGRCGNSSCRGERLWEARRKNKKLWQNATLDISLDDLLNERKKEFAT